MSEASFSSFPFCWFVNQQKERKKRLATSGKKVIGLPPEVGVAVGRGDRRGSSSPGGCVDVSLASSCCEPTIASNLDSRQTIFFPSLSLSYVTTSSICCHCRRNSHLPQSNCNTHSLEWWCGKGTYTYHKINSKLQVFRRHRSRLASS